MRSRAGSIAGLVGVVLCLLGLIERGALLAAHPAGLAAQAVAIALMIWARVTVGLLIRMLAEERLVVARYPEYMAYAARVKRVVPGVW